MCRCPGCGSVFTLYVDGDENVWCSNCNHSCTIRIYEPEIETDEANEEAASKESEFARNS